MTAKAVRTIAAVVAAVGLGGVASAFAGSAPARHAERALVLTPLVWRSSEDAARRIEIARHRRRRLRPEESADDRRQHRHHPEEDAGASDGGETVTVRRGDTINAIARRLHTTPAAIMRANPHSSPHDLHIGETLNVPGPESEPEPGQESHGRGEHARPEPSESAEPSEAPETSRHRGRGRREARERAERPTAYVVRHGDTLFSIARHNDATVDELRALNHLRAGAPLHTGQRIKLPGEGGVTEEEEAPPPPETRPERPSRHPERPTRSSSVAESAFPAPNLPPAEAQAPGYPPAHPVSPGAGAGAPSQPIPYAALPGARVTPVAPPAYTPPAPPAAPPPSTPEAMAPSPLTDAQIAAAGRGRFIWPTRGNMISGFGDKPGGQRNDGVDIAAAAGSPVAAAAAGDVVYAGNLVPGFGNLVLIKHDDGWVTAYAHLAATDVKIKDHVTQGQTIGTVGVSGGVDQPQLHFEVRYAPSPRERARPIDPSLVLPVGQ